jgi:site-specific recombinase XerD
MNFYLAIEKKLESGGYPIYARITINRQKAEISTRQHIKDIQDWDDIIQRVRHRTPTNAVLSKIEGDLTNIFERLKYEGRAVSAALVKNIFLGRADTAPLLSDVMDKYFRERVLSNPVASKATKNNYRIAISHVKAYLESIKQPILQLRHVDEGFIRSLEAFLLAVPISNKDGATFQRNTVNKYLVKFKTIILHAIGDGLIDRNPFLNIKLKMQKTSRTYLTKPELELLENHDLSDNQSLKKVRDIFMFSVYSGLRFADAQALRTENIEYDGSKYWLVFEQKKTKDPVRLPLLIKGKEVLDKYKEEQKVSGFALPRISNQKTNSYLKVIADMVGIKKPLTHHVARHTSATTIFLSNGVPLEVVSKQLGHSSLKVTQVYAKITNEMLSKAADRLDEILK